MQRPKIIAKIACNHKGGMQIVQEIIMVLVNFCKTDVVEFQKSCNREFMEFTLDLHRKFQSWCNGYGIEYSTSVWNAISARE